MKKLLKEFACALLNKDKVNEKCILYITFNTNCGINKNGQPDSIQKILPFFLKIQTPINT